MDRVTDYSPSHHAVDILKKLKPLFLVGPAGSGKDTIVNELLKTGNFYRFITHTTRPPRENHGQLEVEGQDYHFIDHKKAMSMIENQEFIEVTVTHNNLYGTSVDEFQNALDKNQTPVTDLDVKGVMAFKKLSLDCIAIFLLPTSFKELLSRLTSRYGTSIQLHRKDIARRLRSSLFELEALLSTDYYQVIINRDIKDTVSNVLKILDGKYNQERFSKDAKTLAQKLIEDITSYLNSL